MQRRLLFVKKYLLSLPVVLLLLANGTAVFAQEKGEKLFHKRLSGVSTVARVSQGPRRFSSMLSTQAPLARTRLAYAHLGGETQRQQGSIIWPIGGGILGGAAGFFGGGFLGATIEVVATRVTYDWEVLAGFIIGATVGEVVLMPLGVHLGNGGRGNFALDLLASVATSGALLTAAAAFGPDSPKTESAIWIITPALQLGACVAMERVTGRSGGGKH